jgi:alpha-galactosidase
MKTPKTVLLIALTLSLAGALSCTKRGPENPFDGVWQTDEIGSGGVAKSTFFIIEQDGEEFDGYVLMNNAMKVEFDNFVREGNQLTFDIWWGVDYVVTLEEGILEAQTLWPGAEPILNTFRKVDMAAIQTPEAVPLPELETVKANGLAMTPPMGWNSWNHFDSAIDDATVREIADAMVASGMAAAGYEYVVIDDGWQGGRDAEGNIFPNEKFPDMKALADYVHSLGLKLGIYSSPGHTSCGGYIGSYGYEFEDAKTFAKWGIDYLKYDWCGAQLIYGFDRDNMQASYQIMGNALLESGRPIVYSVCQYGREDVWEWAVEVGGNLWRTTGDINDNWDRIEEIGFDQYKLHEYAKPGHWNDPDMLEVGNGNLTVDENKTHFTLWCMLAAPLMAGNDLRSMSPETIAILTNPELIAINQDALGKQAQRLSAEDGIEVYTKPLSSGELAVAIFNRNDTATEVSIDWTDLGWDTKPGSVVNVWPGERLPTEDDGVSFTLPTHGVVLLRGK